MSQFMMEPGTKLICIAKSGTGKTEFCRKLLLCKNIVFTEPPDRIIFYYRYKPNWHEEHEDIEFTDEIPRDIFDQDGLHKLLIIDDCLEKDFPAVADIFLRSGRHSKVTTIVNYQSLFHNSQEFRSMMQNVDILVLFHMTRALYQVSLLCRQVFPNKETVKEVVEIYKKLTREKGGYLLFDFRIESAEYPLRTNVFSRVENGFESIFRA
jgi:hypothetical protein